MRSEHEDQVLFVQWFRRTYPGLRIFAIPNGGGRSRGQGARLKAEGVSPGVPDLFVPGALLWIEMKRTRGGVVSATQRDWLAYLKSLGHVVIVACGFDDAVKQVQNQSL